jgi:hypothetical protein
MMNAEELPAEFGVMHFDRWTNSYRDNFNDIWLIKRHGRKRWELASREAGNQTKVWSRHNKIEAGLIAANALHNAKHTEV